MAGESAQRVHERHRDRRRARLAETWPLIIGLTLITFVAGAVGLPLVFRALGADLPFLWPLGAMFAAGTAARLLAPTQQEVAWRRGAEGERVVGKALDAAPGVLALHDRLIPGSRANIDHIAVTATGVLTIDAKRYRGKLEVRRGVLRVAGRDRSSLVEQAQRQARVVRSVLEEAGLASVPVHPMLCFVGTEMPLLFPPRAVNGVGLTGPRRLASRLETTNGEARLSDHQRHQVVAALRNAFRPAAAKPAARRTTKPAQRRTSTPKPRAAAAPRHPAPVTCGCGAPMVRRERRRDGAPFLGCSTFPACRRTRPLDRA